MARYEIDIDVPDTPELHLIIDALRTQAYPRLRIIIETDKDSNIGERLRELENELSPYLGAGYNGVFTEQWFRDNMKITTRKDSV